MSGNEAILGILGNGPSADGDDVFRSVFDASTNLMAITRPADGMHYTANKAWLDALGYELDEIVGKTSAELGVWADPTVRAEMIRRLEADGRVSGFEASLHGRDGRVRECSISIHPLTIGGERVLLFSATDITEYRRTEAKLRESRALLVDALEAINEGFVLYGADGRLIMCNSTFRDFYGYSEQEAAPGAHRRDLGLLDVERGRVLLNEADTELYINRREDLESGPPKSFIVRLSDGRALLLSEQLTAGGGIVSIQSDITELKKAEDEISAAKDEALLANRAKSEFLANMSHELRTPLNSILGFSEILANEMFGELGSDQYREYAEAIHFAGSHLLAVLGDILDISRIEAGKASVEAAPFAVADAVRDAIAMVDQRAKAAGVEIRFPEPASAAALTADPRHFKQVMLNLLANAVKFTPAGGRITVKAELKAGLDGSGGWRIAIADTGIGIAAEDIPKVLRPFGQVARADSRDHEGTGLGLPICKSLMELHGGSLEIDSEPGRGTRVTVAFPPERTESGKAAATA